MARGIFVLACLAALAAAPEAGALQLTNRDTSDHKISVTEKDLTEEIVIKPSQVIDQICNAGCTIKMADGEEYEFDGNEVVSIEEGLMFLDEPADANSAGAFSAEEAASEAAEPDAVETPDPEKKD